MLIVQACGDFVNQLQVLDKGMSTRQRFLQLDWNRLGRDGRMQRLSVQPFPCHRLSVSIFILYRSTSGLGAGIPPRKRVANSFESVRRHSDPVP